MASVSSQFRTATASRSSRRIPSRSAWEVVRIVHLASAAAILAMLLACVLLEFVRS